MSLDGKEFSICTRLTSFYKPRTWIKLPEHPKSASTRYTFKSGLKTFMAAAAFYENVRLQHRLIYYLSPSPDLISAFNYCRLMYFIDCPLNVFKRRL